MNEYMMLINMYMNTVNTEITMKISIWFNKQLVTYCFIDILVLIQTVWYMNCAFIKYVQHTYNHIVIIIVQYNIFIQFFFSIFRSLRQPFVLFCLAHLLISVTSNNRVCVIIYLKNRPIAIVFYASKRSEYTISIVWSCHLHKLDCLLFH